MSALTLSGVYYDGRIPVGTSATLMFAAKKVVLIGEQVSDRFDTDAIRVSPRTGSASRFVALPGGAQFQCADDPALDRLTHEIPSERFVSWLERRWPVAAICIALIVSVAAWAHLFMLPVAAERIAARIPVATERALGEQALDWLDSNNIFMLSELDNETKQRLLYRFDALVSGLPDNEHYRLGFRSGPMFGANAIALPGGTIVVTDELIQLAETDENVLAILAHEIGHVEKRHALRHVLQDSAVAVVASALTADAASLGVAVAGLPTMLTSLQFSREFETEADDYAFTLMAQNGVSPERFAIIMETMIESMPDEAESGRNQQWSFLSSHPPSEERIARARDAAERFEASARTGR